MYNIYYLYLTRTILQTNGQLLIGKYNVNVTQSWFSSDSNDIFVSQDPSIF